MLKFLSTFKKQRCVVFLDPDNGLEPLHPTLKHVLYSEARKIWNALKDGDIFAFYQHKTNCNGQPWIKPKQKQLSKAIGLRHDSIKIACFPIAKDVVILFTQKDKPAVTVDTSGAADPRR